MADADRYYWMRYAADAATIVTIKDKKVRIEKNPSRPF
jgi:hypothetical protein